MEFEIIKTMRKHKGKWIYMIFDNSKKVSGIGMPVGRIIWDGNKFITDGK